jgi:hypothetical protein
MSLTSSLKVENPDTWPVLELGLICGGTYTGDTRSSSECNNPVADWLPKQSVRYKTITDPRTGFTTLNLKSVVNLGEDPITAGTLGGDIQQFISINFGQQS